MADTILCTGVRHNLWNINCSSKKGNEPAAIFYISPDVFFSNTVYHTILKLLIEWLLIEHWSMPWWFIVFLFKSIWYSFFLLIVLLYHSHHLDDVHIISTLYTTSSSMLIITFHMHDNSTYICMHGVLSLYLQHAL